ncbi:hypothetical protein C7974DRAFT_127518 [Boeremia exigua]|uniref:uncharacterized protein n=1 Tax=Boeremia exigua TaxID=749465 RepID=UPI001E8CA8E4|nr:uncharacterized protein C7974DRAFT_127518 [Boeremia exigua]KAH6639209.1 hypothetical protein C7974DRAFT_127518 [Boeremia exigua]
MMVGLQDLTVGQVSGMIAAAVFIAQILVPLALPVILLGLLQRRSSAVTQTAVSWSVIGRFIHSSLWPIILRTDSAATLVASRSALFMSAFRIFMLVLIAVAAIVTPLGLYEGIVGETESSLPAFHYLEDKSTYGFGTPPRTAISGTWSRICGFTYPIACPNSLNNITYSQNTSGDFLFYDYYDSRIPADVVNAFQSGLVDHEPSVSSSFDIQYRSYIQSELDLDGMGPTIDNGTNPYTRGTYQPLSTQILSDSYLAVEGLIVDMKNGGIGFRKHSAPSPRTYGSSWSEDLLFTEPETVCVDTNLTLEFQIPATTNEKAAAGINEVFKLQLTDRGGFVNLIPEYPAWDRADTQQAPELELRAYKAAWINNALSMAFMNVTNVRTNDTDVKAFSYLHSTMNKTFPLSFPDGKQANDLLTIQASSFQVATAFGGYLDDADQGRSNKSSSGNSSDEYNFQSFPPLYPNPFRIKRSCTYQNDSCLDFGLATLTCAGSGGGDLANITNMAGKCGLLYGTPRRKDGSASLLFNPGSAWTLPMYSCMSVVKASIKTVSFRFNDTDDLSGITILAIDAKEYADEESKPLWGVENSDIELKHGNPLWGIVTPEAAKKLNLSTLRKESLYLPGHAGYADLTSHENLPGADFAAEVLSATYDINPFSSSNQIDYSGKANLAMYRLWQEAFRTPSTSARILNLIWTDIAANLVMGTRGLEGSDNTKRKRDDKPSSGPKIPQVTSYSRRIKYKYVYGIPAFLALFLTIASTLVTAYFTIFGHAKPSKMRNLLEHTSAGRLLAARDIQGRPRDHTNDGNDSSTEVAVADCTEPTKKWLKGAGVTEFTLSAEGWTKSLQPHGPGHDKAGTTASYAPVPSAQN